MIIADIIRLCAALVATSPDVPPARACSAAVAITLAAEEFDPLLVAAIAYGESRFDGSVTNGRCRGPMQVAGGPLGDAGYAAGVTVLRAASRWCVRRGTPGRTCTLAVYASGPRGAREHLDRQPRAVLRRVAMLRRAMGGRPGPALHLSTEAT